jgi:two-component system, chemotaxis family, chemotaxis protein CheY
MELPSKIKSKHFLVVDDYESMRAMICDSLKTLGVSKITTAKSGNEAFRTILALHNAGTPIEFVMTDLVMKDGSGIDLTKMIRANESTRHIPILMVTSKSEVSFVLESIKAGVNSYVVKPWSIEDLNKKLIEVDSKLK